MYAVNPSDVEARLLPLLKDYGPTNIRYLPANDPSEPHCTATLVLREDPGHDAWRFIQKAAATVGLVMFPRWGNGEGHDTLVVSIRPRGLNNDAWIKHLTWDETHALNNVRFCNTTCSSSFREDRGSGLIYPSWRFTFDPQGQLMVGHELACNFQRICPYCKADVTRARRAA